MNVLGSTLNDKTLTLNCSLNTPEKENYKYELQLEGENGVWVSSSEENEGIPPNSFILKNLQPFIFYTSYITYILNKFI